MSDFFGHLFMINSMPYIWSQACANIACFSADIFIFFLFAYSFGWQRQGVSCALGILLCGMTWVYDRSALLRLRVILDSFECHGCLFGQDFFFLLVVFVVCWL
ncbi:hypothetical protein BO70DRAFT_170757 [Aspergillus heteromorphus CBS 117.55]|uniref:Uncharacterized protein n=1 Tax=Aspergillus heteromorphus CBS 117.55 TaxID=1448321 RepID=A0A317V2E4_9EURO|nr:uncharacterized protein BO70DRAFT_170757 [Aspergillus heteromorphus CBS 117.55]PWY67198.1 hypothetical protein BO70DRAFT_170757 [Aspergillus heteromorphus CBS 117.55]